MAFERVKRVTKPNGKTYEYRYWQKSVRIGRKVKSIHLGADKEEERAMRMAERQMAKIDAQQRKEFGETGRERQQREARERTEAVYKSLGVSGKTHDQPVEKAPSAKGEGK